MPQNNQKIVRPIVVAGDLTKKQVVIEDKAVYPASLQGKKKVRNFSHLVGASTIEFMLTSCLEYERFLFRDWSNFDLVPLQDDVKNYLKSSPGEFGGEQMIFGPSSVEDG
jgi:hypothetical protein